jgi:uncharacterized protein (DUF433 family)
MDARATTSPPTDRLLTRREAATVAELSLKALDKAIAVGVIVPSRGPGGQPLLDEESVIVVTLISGERDVTLAATSKMKIKDWVYEARPHLSTEPAELPLTPWLVLRVDRKLRTIAKRLSDYLAGRTRYIESNPQILGGEPVIKGTRISVRAVADRVADGDTIDVLKEDYPDIPKQAFETALLYAVSHPARGRPRKPWRDDRQRARSTP